MGVGTVDAPASFIADDDDVEEEGVFEKLSPLLLTPPLLVVPWVELLLLTIISTRVFSESPAVCNTA